MTRKDGTTSTAIWDLDDLAEQDDWVHSLPDPEEIMRETGPEIPAALQYYIDWKAMGRDLELNGEVFTITLGFDEVHVFWNR